LDSHSHARHTHISECFERRGGRAEGEHQRRPKAKKRRAAAGQEMLIEGKKRTEKKAAKPERATGKRKAG
jgi:hypothetical protein